MFAGFMATPTRRSAESWTIWRSPAELDNTIIVVISDNGASGEGGPNGSVNEGKFFNGYIDTVEESMKVFDHLGGPETYNHYPIGWGDGLQHALQAVQALRLARGWHRRHGNHFLVDGIAAHGEVRDN